MSTQPRASGDRGPASPPSEATRPEPPASPAAGPAPSATRRVLRRLGPLVAITAIYFAFIVYPPLRILTLSLPAWQPGTQELLAIIVGPIAARLACEWVPGVAARAMSAIVMTWLGICFMAFGLVAAWELANAILSLPAQPSGLVLAGSVALLAAAGFSNAQRLRVRTIDIPLGDDAPAGVAGTRFVHLSDVHVGSRSSRFLRRVVVAVNRLEADYVLITGDLIDFANIDEEQLSSLGTLRLPAFFVIGNHERYVDVDAICARLTRLGIRVLRNESTTVGPFQLVGIDDADPRTQVGRILPYLPALSDRYRILLYHRPDGARDAASWGADLMLCGHTHNGQIVPFNHLVRRVFPRICGLYRVDDLHLYVSPGTGTWGPVLRLGSRSEIGIIQLV